MTCILLVCMHAHTLPFSENCVKIASYCKLEKVKALHVSYNVKLFVQISIISYSCSYHDIVL